MAGMTTRRNSPFSPFSEKFDAEILPSLFIREEENGGRFPDAAARVQPTPQTSDEGHAITQKDGRRFRWQGAEPYTRKDGTATVLLVWCGTCAVCGEPFTVKTPQRLEGTKAFARKHCDTHKTGGARHA